jgi:quercetin 2,3-dioxygenase
MIRIRPAASRGRTETGWLDSRHTFSFADYHDPSQMGFRTLRVINDDIVLPGQGFGTHPHRDMEIISYVIEGRLAHKDSLGHGSIIVPGEIQRMSAGTGIQHSEFNPSREEKVRFLQIWILPERHGLTPGYEQRSFPAELRHDRLALVAAPDGRDGAVTIHQDAEIHAGLLSPGATVTYAIKPGRHAWLQVAAGAAMLNGTALVEGDGAAVSGENLLAIQGVQPANFLLFDLA